MSIRTTSLQCVAFGLCLCATALGQPDRKIAAAAALSDARLARRGIETIHPGLTRYTAKEEISAVFDDLERACASDVSEREFFARLSIALAKLRCSHTRAEPSKAWEEWREKTPSYVPFRFVEDDGRLIITRSATDALRPGDEILALQGTASGVVMSQILAAIPADGWTDSARRFALSSMSDLDESEFDNFLPAFVDIADRLRLEVRRPGEAVARSINVKWKTQSGRLAGLGEPPVARNLDEAVSLEIKDKGVAVLRIGTFVAYRKPIKPETIYRPLFERLRNEKVSTLILDLRDNGGGSDDAAADLARFLIATPFTPSSRQWVRVFRFGDLADKLETWDRSVMNMPAELFKDLGNGYFEIQNETPKSLAPLEPVFKGRLLALCGPANASGATLFLADLQSRREVILIGEPTGGSVEGPTAGIILFLPLPNTGIKVRIPAIRTVTGFQSKSQGGGIEPDVTISPTLSERLAEKDVVLERALDMATRSPPKKE